jgi:putative DNA primase/helicase
VSIPDSDSVLDAAHDYAREGWRVIPLHSVDSNGRCTCGKPRCNSEGKHPVQGGWQNTAPLSGADIQATFEDGAFNIGLATGTPSGFWVLDIDIDKPGTGERLKALQAGRKFPTTRIVKTPGGYHYFFLMPDFQVTNSAKRLPDGLDVRGTGGQVVAPPSVSAKGVYTVFLDAPIAPAPDWLLDLVRPLPAPTPVDLETLPKLTDLPQHEQERLRKYTQRAAEAECARLDECWDKGWQGPAWNQTTFEVSCTLIELANSPWSPATLESVQSLVLKRAPKDDHFGEPEILGCFASALKTVAGKGRDMPTGQPKDITVYPGDPLTDPDYRVPTVAAPVGGGGPLRLQTDLGNADRMVDLYQDRLRFIGEADKWVEYIDGAWRTMYKDRGTFFAQEMIRNLIDAEADRYSDVPEEEGKPSDRDKFVKWAVSCQSDTRINACIRQAKARPQLAAKIEDFDGDPDVLNVANGVVNLRTGELMEHQPDRLMMLQSSVRYEPNAEHKKWQEFLDRVQPDPEVQGYLQRALGYSLTGSLAEQALFIHHGSGANGKSVFLVVAALLAGDYGQTVPRETLLSRNNGQTEHPTSVARMRGKRFLQASETAAGRRLDEETVKGLTGGEQQSARYMGKDFFDFTPTGKIHLVTNHLPRLTDAESIWRRLHLVKWGVRIPEEEKNPDMLRPDYWMPEASGLLAWAVRGAVEWYKHGLDVPRSMRDDLMEYRTDQDILGEFISDRLIDEPMMFTPTQEVWNAYSAWAFNHGIKNVMNAHDLGRALRERGFTPHRTGRARGFKLQVMAASQQHAEVDPLLQ